MGNLDVGKYLNFFGIIVVVLFFILGLTILFLKNFEYIPLNYRIIFALLIFAYAGFRLAIIINKSRNEED